MPDSDSDQNPQDFNANLEFARDRREPKHLVQFTDPFVFSPRWDFTTDSKNLYFTISERDADIWTVKLGK